MKLLLDECLPIETVEYRGWKGVKNGKLLALAAPAGFEALITSDEGIEHSQNSATLPMAVIMLHPKSNDLMDIRPLVPHLLQRLAGAITNGFVHIH